METKANGMKLELKHLAPYLPYGLMVDYRGQHVPLVSLHTNYNQNVESVSINRSYREKVYISSIKPILRPLFDLTKEIEHNGEKFVPIEVLQRLGRNVNLKDKYIEEDISKIETWWNTRLCSYWIIEKLFEWHFDVFGLIDAGLAVPKETPQLSP